MNIILKAQQQEALDFLQSPKRPRLSLLKGYAGTGKTTLINFLADTVLTSPTHKASRVLAAKTGKPTQTLHSLLNLQPYLELDNFSAKNVQFKATKLPTPVPANALLVVDEASMVTDDLYDLIINSPFIEADILFVGDPAQLRPISNTTNLSKAFQIPYQFTLTDIIRTDPSPLLQEITKARTSHIIHPDSHIHASNPNIIFTQDEEYFLGEAIRQIRQDPSQTKLLTAKNNNIPKINKIIQDRLTQGNTIFHDHDVLMAYANYLPHITNSSDYIVRDIDDTLTSGKWSYIPVNYYKLRLNPDIHLKLLDPLTPSNILTEIGLEFERKRLAIKKNKHPKYIAMFIKFKDQYVTPIPINFRGHLKIPAQLKLGYCHTIHKSQGSTYETIFFNYKSLFGDPQLKQQLLKLYLQ